MAAALLTRRRAREIDDRAVAEYGLSSLVLMENAGRGAADVLVGLGRPGQVVLCCGKGNNAGDGFVLARHLDLRQVPVRVLLWADPGRLAGDAAVNYRILQRSGVPIDVFGSRKASERLPDLAGTAWLVDALLGTGSRGEPRPPLDAVIDWMNSAGVPVFALDLPSGLDCDTGAAAEHTVRAAHTCTFVAEKRGFAVPAAAGYLGQVHVCDIGAPRKLVDRVLAAAQADAARPPQ